MIYTIGTGKRYHRASSTAGGRVHGALSAEVVRSRSLSSKSKVQRRRDARFQAMREAQGMR